MTDFTLSDLEKIISTKANESPDMSYTASLLKKGQERCTKKFGEEAVELIIAALGNDRNETVSEAADVLYHMLVILNKAGITIDEVLVTLQKRTSMSGLEEKASRHNG